MKQYTKADIIDIYERLVSLSQREAYRQPHISLRNIEIAARWAYSFNWIFTDIRLEAVLKDIASRHIAPCGIKNCHSNRIALIDSFTSDNHGLTQQYIRAMMCCGYHILYISTQQDPSVKGDDIYTELKAYDKVDVVSYSGKKIPQIDMARQIAAKLADFSPSSLFLHLSPWDFAALMACHSVKGTTIFNINLTDHAFWLGASFIDYNIEFRPFGRTVSHEKRNLRISQLLTLPFYPITPVSSHFQGFPAVLPSNAVKVFTGGSLYKMLGDGDVFFKIMERVLSTSPRVYILVAGFNPNDETFARKCALIKNGNRIIPIGRRTDIDNVFSQIDIYLGTYPSAGGLMSQYAARHGKPIIAYRDASNPSKVEDFVCHYQNHYHSFTDLESLTGYCRRLVEDESFRREEGKILQEGMMTPERFTENFRSLVETMLPQWEWNDVVIDYEKWFQRYLELENNNGHVATQMLARKKPLSIITTFYDYKTELAHELWAYSRITPPIASCYSACQHLS